MLQQRIAALLVVALAAIFLVATPGWSQEVTWAATLSNPFPNGIVEPRGAADGAQTFLGQTISFFNPDPSVVYNQRREVSGFRR
jgi:hypothetical protein